eukprot:TRINITY_DN2788_c0_g1_i7.p1 TRINITY_DN2788_c0_g1~~TRINITY_DN2788_c0_g1_i7.p1  ORF type:complete len:483 (-),score=114.46 TRINITY_DN2788_c0_g1_i7:253-1701(-)
MFANLISALQGEVTDEEEGDFQTQNNEQEKQQQQNTGENQKTTGLNIWKNFTSELTNNVKKGAQDLLASVKETDWKREFAAFGQGVTEDTKNVSKQTVQVVEKLPSSAVQSLPVLQHTGEEVKSKLGEVGNQLSNFGQQLYVGTKEIIHTVKDQVEKDIGEAASQVRRSNRTPISTSSNVQNVGGTKYNRLQAEISSMQRASSTYLEEPEEKEDYQKWKQTFSLTSKRQEIDRIMKENAFMAELQQRIVPLIVDYETFWIRYFYRLEQIETRHAQRVAIASKELNVEEEEVSWDDNPSPTTQESVQDPPQGVKEEVVEQVGDSQQPQIEGYHEQHYQQPSKSKDDTGSMTSSIVYVEADNGNGSEVSSQSSWQVVGDKKSSSPPQEHIPLTASAIQEELDETPPSESPTHTKATETTSHVAQQQDDSKKMDKPSKQTKKEDDSKTKVTQETIEEELEYFDLDDVQGGEDDGEEVDEDWGTWE